MLMVNANEREKDDNHLNSFIKPNSLHNVHAMLFARQPVTTRDGCNRRIDFMFASEYVLRYARSVG